MPEYMDYNDFEDEFKTKRQRRNANIRLVVAILFIASVVFWVIFRTPENVRSDFGPVFSAAHSSGEKKDNTENEFLNFYMQNELDENINENEQFKSDYPNIYSLLHLTKDEISKDAVKTFESGNAFCVARVYVISRQTNAQGDYLDESEKYVIGETGIDFCVFTYDTDDGFTVNKPLKFSIHYHAKKTDIIPYLYKYSVSSKSFRLNFYTLSVEIESNKTFSAINTSLMLTDGINETEYDNDFFYNKIKLINSENKELSVTADRLSGGGIGDKIFDIEYGLPSPLSKANVQLRFDDTMYNKFLSLTVGKVSGAKYKIVVN